MRAESQKSRQKKPSSLWVWPFELEEKIGEGGMGVVYRGRYVKNDRRVAVKLLPLDVADENILARFEREMDLLKSLRHPHIVYTFGGVCEDHRRFYAMELVEGGSLETLLKSQGGKLPWQEVLPLGQQMCAALQYAHEQGIIHRDIKPGNFLLTPSGKLKLSDFGLATVVAGHKLTAEGKTVGSFRYMAPEQIRGRPEPAPQTDLYGLGCVLFQMVAGRPPFEGDHVAELLNKHLTAPPPRLGRLVPDCPLLLEQLIYSLLEKEMRDRPSSAAEVAETLRKISLSTNSVTLKTPPKSPLRVQPATETASTATPSAKRLRRWLTPGRLAAVWGVLTLLLIFALLDLFQRNRHLQQAEELWLQMYRQGEREDRIRAAEALGQLARHSDPALEALVAGLDQSDATVRTATIRALGETGYRAQDLIPRLMRLQHDENDRVRSAATLALDQIRTAEKPETSGTNAWLLGLLLLGMAGIVWFALRQQLAIPAKGKT